MDFGVNKTSIEVIKEDAFRGTYFRDIYSNGTKNDGKDLTSRKILIRNIIVQIIVY